MIDNASKDELEQKWLEKFPETLSGLFAFYQCLCTIAILGCEIGSILIDLFNATIYVGIWASIFFMIAWILQVVSVSCRRTRKFAKYTLISQCIALFFAVCVIGFDAYFIIDPTTCFFSSTLCNSTAPSRGLFYSQDYFNNIKMPLIKGQLGIATVMFAFSIDYIIIYTVIHIHIKNYTQSLLKTTTKNTTNRVLGSAFNGDITNNRSLQPTDMNSSTRVDLMIESSFMKSIHRSSWSMDSINLSPVEI